MDAQPYLKKFKISSNLFLAAGPMAGALVGSLEMSPRALLQVALVGTSFFLLFAGIRLYQQRPPLARRSVLALELENALFLIAMISGAATIMYAFFPNVALMWIATGVLCALFTNDLTRLYRTPVLSTLLLFGMMLVGFYTGFKAAGTMLTMGGLLYGFYFAMLFAADQLTGELIAHGLDHSRPSNPRTFGPRTVLRFSFAVFAFAFAFLLVLTLARFLPVTHAIPFLLIFPLHTEMFLRRLGHQDVYTLQRYRFYYRTLVVMALVAYWIIRFSGPANQLLKKLAG